MPDASDYTSDRALVPGTLTVFRHFLCLGGKLMPMSSAPSTWSSGSHLRDAYPPRGPFTDPSWDGRFRAVCMREATTAVLRELRLSEVAPSHPAPRVGCRCGFYAHYDPDTDFYPGVRWGTEWNRQRYSGTRWRGQWETSIVRAVVEVSGTVVMGRLGVRAERMKIVALAVDWAKHARPNYLTPRFRLEERGLRPGMRLMFVEVEEPYDAQLDYAEAGRREREVAGRDAVYAASLYGAQYYEEAEDMYADYPMEDVSALGVDTSPPAPPGPRYLSGAGRYVYNNGGIIPPSKRAWGDVGAAPQKLNPFERALLNKKNRPAPPGTGIDRRKRKL